MVRNQIKVPLDLIPPVDMMYRNNFPSQNNGRIGGLPAQLIPPPLMNQASRMPFMNQHVMSQRGFPFPKGRVKRRPFRFGKNLANTNNGDSSLNGSGIKRKKFVGPKLTDEAIKGRYLAKPWVNDALKAEVEKRFIMLEEAKTKNEPALWETYLQQKELVNNMNRTLRLEYLGSHSETPAENGDSPNVEVEETNTMDTSETSVPANS